MKKIYLIHGSLGAGKTTLLNSMLTKSFFKKSIVIENEFASFSIDDYLVDSKFMANDTKTIAGGCICCTSGSEFLKVLSSIAVQNDIEKIIIESTGVANSIEIIKQILLSSDYDLKYDFGANIMLIDALEDNMGSIISEKKNEIKIADLVLVSKTDLINSRDKNKIIGSLQSLNENVEILENGLFKDDKYFNINFKSNLVNAISENMDVIFQTKTNLLKDNYHVLEINNNISDIKLRKFIEELTDSKSMNIKRIKGFYTNDLKENFIVNGTKRNIQYFKTTKKNNSKNNTLVIIGENIKSAVIEKTFNKFCLTT